MKRLLIYFALLLFANIASAQVAKPVKWQVSLQKSVSDAELPDQIKIVATIEEGWHLYGTELPEDGPMATAITFDKIEGVTIDGKPISTEKPITKYDSSFDMELNFFENEVIFIQKIKITDENKFLLGGTIEFMACDDERCIPPDDYVFELKLEQPVPLKKNIDTESAPEATTPWAFFWLAFLGGLAAIFTPCVFPMIPMTMSFFMKGSGSKTKGKMMASFYGLSIVGIYTVIGTIVALAFGANFANFLSTHWLPNTLFFLIFMVFAASFLGAFEITMPSWLINKSTANEDKGGLAGVFFMAFTLVLVSFSCTGPIVGAILVASAGGEILTPVIGMLGFSLAFALPFTFFALFPGLMKNLPKSGGWLNTVKVILGFIEIALGLKFLSIADQTYHWGILDREVYLAIWIVVFTLLGFYLLGKLKFAHDSDTKYTSTPRLFMAIVTFSFVVYLIPGMIGAPLKALAGYLPPETTHDFDLNAIIRDNSALQTGKLPVDELCEKPKYADFLHLPHGLSGYFDYDQALACSKEQNKPLFIDFTGHGCVNCREMEARVWSDPRILNILRNDFIVVALYVDDKTTLPESEWVTSSFDGKVKKTLGKINADFEISRFKVNSQPYYCLLDQNEELLVPPKAYDLDVESFLEYLEEAKAAFKK